ncbi:polysaccharide deacetylase family protein [Legionella saoudiensis]|uniref:polysaccharide deacetylase family protein n=1 Tax=Legionella saoudiensis TaxID=1750561 RepID=UPI000730981E|nr:polysaccharide deacetylase family protein [Legionella saoudiensis]
MRRNYFILALSLIILSIITYATIPNSPCTPKERTIAITLDDLPIEYAQFEKISRALTQHKAPAIGFVIGKKVNEDTSKELQAFLEAGFTLGSHSYSHLNLRKVSAAAYIADVERADKILSPFMTGSKYYRYPYLAESSFVKKRKVLHYLEKKHYRVAPVTIDSRDFLFNLKFTNEVRANPKLFNTLRQHYLDFVWQQTRLAEKSQRCAPTKQILLLHANILNSYFLDDLLQMFENHGYRFISLEDALN